MQAKWTDRGDTGTLQGKITKTTTKALLGGLQERDKWKDQTKMKKQNANAINQYLFLVTEY